MTENEMVMLGVAEAVEAERLRSRFAQNDIKAELLHNKETCTTGCKTTLEVWVKKRDVDAIAEIFKAEYDRKMAGLDFDYETITQTFDTSKETAICPACSTEFSTTLGECPDCGLVFSVPGT